MGTDTPISPDSGTTSEVAPETGAAMPAVDSASDTAPAAVAQADAAESPTGDETAVETLEPPAEPELPLPGKKPKMKLILMAAALVLAIGVFAVVYFVLGQGGSTDQAANNPTMPAPTQQAPQTTPAPPPTTSQPVTPPTTTPPPTAPQTMPPTGVRPGMPTPQQQAAVTPAAPTLIPPAAPAYATPIQSKAVIVDPFDGGPMPPKIAVVKLKNITPIDLKNAMDEAKVDVSVNYGKTEDEVLLVGYAAQLNRAKALAKQVDVPEPPIVVVASLPSAITTRIPRPVDPKTQVYNYPPIPIATPPGRHAGWIYNNNNGQVVAIFEDRTGMAHAVQVGDVVDGMRVISITPNELVLQDMRQGMQGAEYRLKMQGLDTSPSRTSITATPAGAGAPAMPNWPGAF